MERNWEWLNTAIIEGKNINYIQQVDCELFDYSLKYQDRSKLDRLFAMRGDRDEVLITINGIITDTSYSNVVLFDGSTWYTPEQPLLEGYTKGQTIGFRRDLSGKYTCFGAG